MSNQLDNQKERNLKLENQVQAANIALEVYSQAENVACLHMQ